MVGSDVNLIHRLTKNHVSDETGWHAYALFTEVCLKHVGVPSEGLHEQSESYEHLGEVKTYSLDLRQRYKEITEARRVFLTPEEATRSVEFDIAAPPAVVWEWLSDPRRKNQVSGKDGWSAMARPGGRAGVGATNHCAHGKNGYSCQTVLDWRPFDYYTVKSEGSRAIDALFNTIETYQFEPADDGQATHLRMNVKLVKLPGWLGRGVGALMAKVVKDFWLPAVERKILEEGSHREETQYALPEEEVMTPVAVGDGD